MIVGESVSIPGPHSTGVASGTILGGAVVMDSGVLNIRDRFKIVKGAATRNLGRGQGGAERQSPQRAWRSATTRPQPKGPVARRVNAPRVG